MDTLVEKIKNWLSNRKKAEFKPSGQEHFKAFIGAGDISRSINESKKWRLKKHLWRNIFH